MAEKKDKKHIKVLILLLCLGVFGTVLFAQNKSNETQSVTANQTATTNKDVITARGAYSGAIMAIKQSTDGKTADDKEDNDSSTTSGAQKVDTNQNETSNNSNNSGSANSSSSGSTNSNASQPAASSQPSAPTQHVHNWVPITTTVHHDAVTHVVHHNAVYNQQYVVDQPAQYGNVCVCITCGAEFPNSDVWLDHALETDHGNYTIKEVMISNEVGHYEDVLVSDAWDETVVDSAAWDETVTTGYQCSECGATQ